MLQEKIDNLFQEIEQVKGSDLSNRLTSLNLNREAKIRNLIFALPHPYLQLIKAENHIHSRQKTIEFQEYEFELAKIQNDKLKIKLESINQFSPSYRKYPVTIEDTVYYSQEYLDLAKKELEIQIKISDPYQSEFYVLLKEAQEELAVALQCKQEILAEHPEMEGLDAFQLESRYGQESVLAIYEQKISVLWMAQEYGIPKELATIILQELSPQISKMLLSRMKQTIQKLRQKINPDILPLLTSSENQLMVSQLKQLTQHPTGVLDPDIPVFEDQIVEG